MLAPNYSIVKKPENLSHLQACALPYTMCTVWSSLVTVNKKNSLLKFQIARLNPKNAKKNRVLIHGGSGGIGTTAIQLLKAWGVPKIVATCSLEKYIYFFYKNIFSAELIEKLGAIALDYRSSQIKQKIISEGPFEIILDCVDNSLSAWSDQVLHFNTIDLYPIVIFLPNTKVFINFMNFKNNGNDKLFFDFFSLFYI